MASNQSRNSTGVRLRCCAEHTFMPAGTSPPARPTRGTRPPDTQCVGCLFTGRSAGTFARTIYSQVRFRATCPKSTWSTSIVIPPNRSANSPGLGISQCANRPDPRGCSSTPPNARTCSTARGPHDGSWTLDRCFSEDHGPHGGWATTGHGPLYSFALRDSPHASTLGRPQ